MPTAICPTGAKTPLTKPLKATAGKINLLSGEMLKAAPRHIPTILAEEIPLQYAAKQITAQEKSLAGEKPSIFIAEKHTVKMQRLIPRLSLSSVGSFDKPILATGVLKLLEKK